MINLREVSKSSEIVMPALSSIGNVSSKILPFDRARVNMPLLSYKNLQEACDMELTPAQM
jgi:hypothetical protein